MVCAGDGAVGGEGGGKVGEVLAVGRLLLGVLEELGCEGGGLSVAGGGEV